MTARRRPGPTGVLPTVTAGPLVSGPGPTEVAVAQRARAEAATDQGIGWIEQVERAVQEKLSSSHLPGGAVAVLVGGRVHPRAVADTPARSPAAARAVERERARA